MKRIVLVIFGLLGYASVEAQGLVNSGGLINSGRSQIRRSNDMDFSVFDRDIKGTPFLFDKMYPGTVYEKSGKSSKFTQMDINISENEVHVNQNGRVTVLDNDKVQRIEIETGEDQVLVYYPISYLNKVRYFELLYEQDETHALFIYHEKYFSSTNNRIEIASVTDEGDEFKYKNDLFWYDNGEISRIKSGNSGLKLVFGDDWKKAKSIADKNDIALKSHGDWLKLIDLMEK